MWFPHLAAERVLRSQSGRDPTQPFAVVGMRKSALRLCSINAAAQMQGLAIGMALTDARAIMPGLTSAPEQPERDARFLESLGRWSEQYSPWIALDGEDGLVLDITGCAHLFGDETTLLKQFIMRLDRLGLTVRAGLSDTKGAAWALARFSADTRIAAPGCIREAVSALPVSALRIDSKIATTLSRLGLQQIADVDGMPRAALARRFGAMLVRRLDQMFGAEPEPVATTVFMAPYAVRLTLPEPIGKTEDVKAALDRLLGRLCSRLQREERGAQTLRLSIRRSDGGSDAIEVSFARPSYEPARMAPLFEPSIEKMDAGFGIDAVRLEALVTHQLKKEQIDNFIQKARSDDALGDTIARIGNRIGFDRVTRFLPAESHIPERAFTVAAAAYSDPEIFRENGLARPLVLFPPELVKTGSIETPPQQFQWRGVSFDIHIATGPERIAPEWWWDDPNWRSGPRDYWRVQTTKGRRLWLFQTHGAETAGWFAQGEFA